MDFREHKEIYWLRQTGRGMGKQTKELAEQQTAPGDAE